MKLKRNGLGDYYNYFTKPFELMQLRCGLLSQ